MVEDRITVKKAHNLILEDRRNLMVSGVSDVDSFDEQIIVVYTELGELTVKGKDLHIVKLSIETGELNVEGSVNTLEYADINRNSGGKLFSRLFK